MFFRFFLDRVLRFAISRSAVVVSSGLNPRPHSLCRSMSFPTTLCVLGIGRRDTAVCECAPVWVGVKGRGRLWNSFLRYHLIMVSLRQHLPLIRGWAAWPVSPVDPPPSPGVRGAYWA